MVELNIKSTAAIYHGYDTCDYAHYHAVQQWVTVESLLKYLQNKIDNIPTVDAGSIEYRDAQADLLQDLTNIFFTKHEGTLHATTKTSAGDAGARDVDETTKPLNKSVTTTIIIS